MIRQKYGVCKLVFSYWLHSNTQTQQWTDWGIVAVGSAVEILFYLTDRAAAIPVILIAIVTRFTAIDIAVPAYWLAESAGD